MITSRIKNYITGIMSIIAGIINILLFILALPSNLHALWSLYFFLLIPGIVGLLPIPLLIFNISLEKRPFVNVLCFFVSSTPLMLFGLLFLRLGFVFPLFLLSILFLIISKKSNIVSKEGVRLIALLIIVLILIPYSLLSLFSVFAYNKAIIRNTSNAEEANALNIAENINYSEIFDTRRFTTTGNLSEDVYYDEKYLHYAWANFIDTRVIEYYNKRFEDLKKGLMSTMKPKSVKFQYEANVSTREQIRVVYDPPPKNNMYTDTIQVLSPNGSVLFEIKRRGEEMLCACRVDPKYQWMDCSIMRAEGINFSLSKSYIIEMNLEYDEIWGLLAGFFVRVYQFIIIDENFEPLLLCIESTQCIS